ncbi:MAG: glucosamine-6-phosphate isomerase [Mangrovibacterium sp.]
MRLDVFSDVERKFVALSGIQSMSTKIPYIMVGNFPKLGFLTALRFLEWVSENPEGVISLPTGKTPEYFIKWTQHLLREWDSPKVKKIRKEYNLKTETKPDLSKLHFVQIDEFYPISSAQHNSFYQYVKKFYIEGFGLDPNRAILINSDAIALPDNEHFSSVFPDNNVDISLRYREAKTSMEQKQQRAIFAIDDWCSEYERKIRALGGIGFFLGGIGPDGHIAFNTRGSDLFSTTRLTPTNFETQAVSAGDLGGIEVSRSRLVITIGLETITYNPNATAIIFGAGEAKAGVIKDALEHEHSVLFPATVLQQLKNARFYITEGAGVQLKDSIERYYTTGEWTKEKTEHAVISLCHKLDKYGTRLTVDDLKNDEYCKLIPAIDEHTVKHVIDSVVEKINRGIQKEIGQTFYHTGPHHDDIMLGLMPHLNSITNPENESHFAVLTSGFTAVTNQFVIDALIHTKQFLDRDEMMMVNYPDFFEIGYKYKWDKDVYHYLNKVAQGELQERKRGLAHRLVRGIVSIWDVKSKDALRNTIESILSILRTSYDGEKNPIKIQKLKGMLREYEEELVWAYYGTQVKNVHHLRLGFYTGDIFTEQPKRDRDAMPVLEQLREIKPTVISLALDPEGSGPDTHYKVLQVIAEAVRMWKQEEDLSNLRIWGYRNVWYKFQPSDVNVISPVHMTDLAILQHSFEKCYLSQVNASFPSFEHDGMFCDLAQRNWVNQLKSIQLLLGKDYFYTHESSSLRATHGLIFFKEMNVEEFLTHAAELEKSVEGIV